MELKQMRYFMALAQERNFSRAAERLNMAQPPLTRQIRNMEEMLGTPLFLRTAKGVDLTDAGQSLLEEVPNILALADRVEERARLNGQGLVGRLEVGSFGSGMLKMVPRVLAEFHTLRPDVEISLHHLDKGEQIKALRERRIAVGFACLVPREADLKIETMLREKIIVALYEGHALCAKTEINVRDLDDQPMILYPNSEMAGLAQSVTDAFRRGRSRLRVEQKVEDSVTAIALVSSGYGLCITTDSAGNLRLPGVVYRPFVSPHLQDLELSCFYRRGDVSPVLKEFLDIVRAFATKDAAKDAANSPGLPKAKR
jgi:LysR family transcriptional regulator, benzoate and cis,cis-muconate-responsive activator of ben and cat genes